MMSRLRKKDGEGKQKEAPAAPGILHSGIVDMLLAQAISMVASVLVTYVTAHFLGPSGRGQVAFVISTGSLLGAVAFGSIHVGVTHAHKAGDPTALPRGLRLSILSAAGVCLATLTIAAIMSALHQPLAGALALAAMGSALVCFSLSVSRIRQGLGDARAFRNAWTISSVVYVILGTVAAGLAHSARAVIYAWLLSMILSIAYALRGYGRDHGPTLAAPPRISTRSIIATSLSAHFGFIGIQVLYRADIVILGFIVSTRQLGIYSIAAPVAELTWAISEALSLVAFSQVRALQTPKERQVDRHRLISLNMVAGAVGSIVVVVTAILLLPRILPAYTAATPLVLILLPGVLVQGSSRIAFSSLVATGVQRPAIIVGLVSAILALLYIPFALTWGITGAAIASTIIYMLQAIVVFRIIRRQDAHAEHQDSSTAAVIAEL